MAVSIAINNETLPKDKGHKSKANDDKGIFDDWFTGAGDEHDINHNVERTLKEVNPAWLPPRTGCVPRGVCANTAARLYPSLHDLSGCQKSLLRLDQMATV